VRPAGEPFARSLWLWTTAALGIVLLALVATIATLALVRDDGTRELHAAALPWQEPGGALTDSSRAVADAARTETLAFLEVDYRDMEPLTEKVLDGAAGEFEKQYSDRVEDLVAQAKQNKSISHGEVVALGIGELDEDSALVYVAANSQVQNRSTGGTPQPRYYRLQLDMVREGDEWLVSQLQFVG
jgi:Mce-associated membrane protein